MYRLYVSAAHKSSGKTTVAIGLAAALRARGLAVQPFKKGPDFIDPLWLRAGARRRRHNPVIIAERGQNRGAFDRRHAGIMACVQFGRAVGQRVPPLRLVPDRGERRGPAFPQ